MPSGARDILPPRSSPCPLCPLWPQTCVSPPGLTPDRAWVSFKASGKVHTTGFPATGRRSFPGETWNVPPDAWDTALNAHLQQLRRGEAWPQLFVSYGANFSTSVHSGTSPREVFFSQLPLHWQFSCLHILSAGVISAHHYPGQCSSYGRTNPRKQHPHLMSPDSTILSSLTWLTTKRLKGSGSGATSAWTVTGSTQCPGCLALARVLYSCCV